MNVSEEGQKQLFFYLRGQILLAHGPGSVHSCSGRWKTWDTQWPQVTSLMMRPGASARCCFHLPVSVSVLGRHGGAGFCAELACSPCMCGVSLGTQKTHRNFSYIFDWMEGETHLRPRALYFLGIPRWSWWKWLGRGPHCWGWCSPTQTQYCGWKTNMTRWTNNSMYFTAHLRPLLVKVWVNR